jgi:hypothetical protein
LIFAGLELAQAGGELQTARRTFRRKSVAGNLEDICRESGRNPERGAVSQPDAVDLDGR